MAYPLSALPPFPSFPDLPDGKLTDWTYQPAVRLSEDTCLELSQILAEARKFEGEGENPSVLADWTLLERQDASSLVYRSHISLFRDGCDGADRRGHWRDVGVLFYREDFITDLSAQLEESAPQFSRVHIPGPDAQDTLLDAWDYLADFRCGDRRKLEVIRAYLTRIVNDQADWTELTS